MGTERWVNEGTVITDTKRVLAALNKAMPGLDWVVDAKSGDYQTTTSLTPDAAKRLQTALLDEPLLPSADDLKTEGIKNLISFEAAGNGNVQMRIHNRGIRKSGLKGLEDLKVIKTLNARTQVELSQQQKPHSADSLDVNGVEQPPSIPGRTGQGVRRS